MLPNTTLTLNRIEELLQKGCKDHNVVITVTVFVKLVQGCETVLIMVALLIIRSSPYLSLDYIKYWCFFVEFTKKYGGEKVQIQYPSGKTWKTYFRISNYQNA